MQNNTHNRPVNTINSYWYFVLQFITNTQTGYFSAFIASENRLFPAKQAFMEPGKRGIRMTGLVFINSAIEVSEEDYKAFKEEELKCLNKSKLLLPATPEILKPELQNLNLQ